MSGKRRGPKCGEVAPLDGVFEIRRLNLVGLLSTGLTHKDLAERVGTAPAVISQYVRASSKATGGRASMGNDIARRIERALGMEDGAMDTPQDWGAASARLAESATPAEAAAWLVTGGRSHQDAPFLTVDEASAEVLKRNDGSSI